MYDVLYRSPLHGTGTTLLDYNSDIVASHLRRCSRLQNTVQESGVNFTKQIFKAEQTPAPLNARLQSVQNIGPPKVRSFAHLL